MAHLRELLFLSTLSLRRATQVKQTCRAEISISIHALLAESDSQRNCRTCRDPISIHALLAESDSARVVTSFWFILFLSTLSLRRATITTSSLKQPIFISIHALLAESDSNERGKNANDSNFYPRSPCGERPKSDTATAFPLSFLSTLSLRRATFHAKARKSQSSNFYPRSPCGERQDRPRPSTGIHDFYPRSPCGERLRLFVLGLLLSYISIHALLAESDAEYPRRRTLSSYFYPRSPCGERPFEVRIRVSS